MSMKGLCSAMSVHSKKGTVLEQESLPFLDVLLPHPADGTLTVLLVIRRVAWQGCSGRRFGGCRRWRR